MEILKKALDRGIIDVTTIIEKVTQMENNEFLSKHKSSIWQDSTGRWSTYLQTDTGRKLVKKKSREAVEKAIIDFYRQQDNGPTFNALFYEWINLKVKYGEIQKGTLDRYENAFKKYFDAIKDVPIETITECDLEDYIKTTIHDFELTIKRYGDVRIIINGVFKYAKRKGYTDISITSFMGDLELSNKIFKKRKFTDEESVFTSEEVKQIIGAVNKKPNIHNLAVLFAFETGLRVGELSTLKYSDIDGNKLHVSRTEIRYKENGVTIIDVRESTKGKAGSRTVILTPNALDTLKRIKRINPFGEYIFENNGHRIKGQNLTKQLYYICDALGIKRRSLHKARKTYATMLLDAGVSERLIINQLGHTDISTTKEYYHFNNKTDNEAIVILQGAIGEI